MASNNRSNNYFQYHNTMLNSTKNFQSTSNGLMQQQLNQSRKQKARKSQPQSQQKYIILTRPPLSNGMQSTSPPYTLTVSPGLNHHLGINNRPNSSFQPLPTLSAPLAIPVPVLKTNSIAQPVLQRPILMPKQKLINVQIPQTICPQMVSHGTKKHDVPVPTQRKNNENASKTKPLLKNSKHRDFLAHLKNNDKDNDGRSSSAPPDGSHSPFVRRTRENTISLLPRHKSLNNINLISTPVFNGNISGLELENCPDIVNFISSPEKITRKSPLNDSPMQTCNKEMVDASAEIQNQVESHCINKKTEIKNLKDMGTVTICNSTACKNDSDTQSQSDSMNHTPLQRHSNSISKAIDLKSCKNFQGNVPSSSSEVIPNDEENPSPINDNNSNCDEQSTTDDDVVFARHVKKDDISIKSFAKRSTKEYTSRKGTLSTETPIIEDVDNTKERKFKCMMCKEGFNTQRQLSDHYVVCDIKLPSLKNDSKSRERVDGIDEIVCEYDNCDYSSPYQENYRRHVIKEHTKEFDFECLRCWEGFVSRYELQKHDCPKKKKKKISKNVTKENKNTSESLDTVTMSVNNFDNVTNPTKDINYITNFTTKPKTFPARKKSSIEFNDAINESESNRNSLAHDKTKSNDMPKESLLNANLINNNKGFNKTKRLTVLGKIKIKNQGNTKQGKISRFVISKTKQPVRLLEPENSKTIDKVKPISNNENLAAKENILNNITDDENEEEIELKNKENVKYSKIFLKHKTKDVLGQNNKSVSSHELAMAVVDSSEEDEEIFDTESSTELISAIELNYRQLENVKGKRFFFKCRHKNCKYMTKIQMHFVRHCVLKHKDPKPFKCRSCLESFFSKSARSDHINSKHPIFVDEAAANHAVSALQVVKDMNIGTENILINIQSNDKTKIDLPNDAVEIGVSKNNINEMEIDDITIGENEIYTATEDEGIETEDENLRSDTSNKIGVRDLLHEIKNITLPKRINGEYPCPFSECFYRTASSKTYKKHYVRHSLKFNFSCPWCHLGFNRKRDIKFHCRFCKAKKLKTLQSRLDTETEVSDKSDHENKEKINLQKEKNESKISRRFLKRKHSSIESNQGNEKSVSSTNSNASLLSKNEDQETNFNIMHINWSNSKLDEIYISMFMPKTFLNSTKSPIKINKGKPLCFSDDDIKLAVDKIKISEIERLKLSKPYSSHDDSDFKKCGYENNIHKPKKRKLTK